MNGGTMDYAGTVSGWGWVGPRQEAPDHLEGDVLVDGVWYQPNCDPFMIPRKDGFKVRCSCGSFDFTLAYGAYKILATCSKCGKSDSVYLG